MTDPARIRILTLNIGKDNNLAGILQLANPQAHVLLLQEVALDQEGIDNIASSRGYKATLSRGEGALGVAILTHESLTDTQVETLEAGRLQACYTSGIKIINVYGPSGTNLTAQRREFISTTLLAACRTTGTVVAGDFNCVTSPLDVEENFRIKQSIELNQLVQTMEMIDVYREKKPLGRDYTFHRPGTSSSRLDRVYLTKDITATEYLSTPTLSDHVAVGVVLDLPAPRASKVRKLRSNWKLNTTVLQDPDIRDKVQGMIIAADLTNHPENWEGTKEDIVQELKDLSTLKHKLKQGTFQMLSWELEQAIGEKDWEQIAFLKGRIKTLVKHRLHGAMVRSGSIQEDDEDEATLYHAKKEASRRKLSDLTQLRINGIIEANPIKIKQEIKDYYNALYNGHHRTINGEIINTGVNFEPDWEYMDVFCKDMPTIPETDAQLVQAEISTFDVEQTVKECKMGTSPGPDGLPYEFYRTFNSILAPGLARVYNHYLEQKAVPWSYKVGTTRLIPKVTGIPSVDELRPITLQSCEYKILAKIYTKRILGTLDSVIGERQHCAIPGRRITTPLVNTLSTIEYVNRNNINAYLLSTDIFKAYDRTHVRYILQIMKRMGFSQQTLDTLELLLHGCETTIQILDGITVLIIQGLKQGCPLSVPLFIINMEPLIRKLAAIASGVQIGRVCQTVEGFMDDVNIFSTKRRDLLRIDETFQQYEMLSSTLLSRSKKTKILGLGGWKEEEEWELPWLKPVKQMRILGIQVSSDIDATYQMSWNIVVTNIRAMIQKWISRKDITLAGKVRIANVLILAKVWYTGQTMPIQQEVVCKIERAISYYLFNNKIERIQLEQLYTKKEKGGLELVNIQAKCQALLAKTVYSSLEAGNHHLRYWLAIPLRGFLNIRGARAELTTSYFKALGALAKEVYQTKKNKNKPITTKLMYQDFMSSPPPSRVEMIGELPATTVCSRMHRISDKDMLEFYFQAVTNTLPTKARLHHLNPGRWEEALCTWCRNEPGNTEHIFIRCRTVGEIWDWLRQKIFKLEPQSIVWTDKEILWLNYPKTRKSPEISYLVIKVTSLWWKYLKEHRILTVRRLEAIVRHDMVQRKLKKLEQLSELLYRIIM